MIEKLEYVLELIMAPAIPDGSVVLPVVMCETYSGLHVTVCAQRNLIHELVCRVGVHHAHVEWALCPSQKDENKVVDE
jgi:hypothetical protein